MKLTNKLGIYKVTGNALKNYHRMQCRPSYWRYCYMVARNCQSKGWPRVEPISFDLFCEFNLIKQAVQEQLF
jgi:hypothetical protein